MSECVLDRLEKFMGRIKRLQKRLDNTDNTDNLERLKAELHKHCKGEWAEHGFLNFLYMCWFSCDSPDDPRKAKWFQRMIQLMIEEREDERLGRKTQQQL